jgi:hypothetical protein
MAAKAKPFSIDSPIRGLVTRDLKSSRLDQALTLWNLLPDKRNEVRLRPGLTPYNYAFDFAAKKHYGMQKYIDRDNIQRLITVNNGQIQEFTHGVTTNKIETTNRFHAFAIGNQAIFASDGQAKLLKGFGANWSAFGSRGPVGNARLTQGTGGSLADGVYLVAMSYALKSGDEYLIITACEYGSDSITISGGSGTAKIEIQWSGGPLPPFTHTIIWCTAVDGSTFYFSHDVVAGLQDSSISVAPTSGVELTPYQNNFGIQSSVLWMNFADDALWIIEKDLPTQIKRSNQGTHYDNESFPTGNVKQFPTAGLPLTYCVGLGAGEYVMTKHGTFRLSDYDLNAKPEIVSRDVGTDCPWSWAPFEDGIVGITNRGVEYFNGYRFYKMSDDIYELIKSDTLTDEIRGGLNHGILYDDPRFGPMYIAGMRLPSDIQGGVGELPGYLPGSGSGGTGRGTPSDNFDDSDRNTTRWNETAGVATMTEDGTLAISKTEQTVEDVYWESTCKIDQAIHLKVKAAVSTHTGSAHDLTQYAMLRYDADNYVEVGYRDVNGTLTLRAKVCKAGTVTNTDVSSPPESTELAINLFHDRVEILYMDAVNAWTFILADTFAWELTGWAVRLGVRCDSATSDPTFAGYFDELRVQFWDGTGLESIIEEDFYSDVPNSAMICLLRGWIPGSRDGENNEIQPPWFPATIKPQCLLKNNDNELLFADSTTGKVYRLDISKTNDDGDMIVTAYQTPIIDGKTGSTGKYLTKLDITGSWAQPYKMRLISYPSKAGQEKTVTGYGTGTAFATAPFSSFKFAGAASISRTVKFRKMLGTAFSLLIRKMDYDASFHIESIEPELKIVRGER